MLTKAAYGTVYGTALIVVGLGSAFFHASLTRMGGFLDVTGMYLLASFILVYNLYRLHAIREQTFVLFYIVLNAVLVGALAQLPGIRRYIFAALIIAALAVERQVRLKEKPVIETYWIKMALLFMGVAFMIWILDITRTFYAPYSWLQGHAIWHILGAMAAGCLYLYYRSERIGQLHSSQD